MIGRHLAEARPRRAKPRGETAFTLIELLITASILVLVLGALFTLVIEMAKEQRRSLIDASLELKAGILQDRLVRTLRSMSAGESVILGEPIASGSPLFRRVIVARGQGPALPREELIFSTNTMTLTHDQDRSVTGNELTLFQSRTGLVLRSLSFFASLKSDSSPDSSAVNILFTLDDDGFAGRKNTDRTPKRTQVTRSFTVKLRNY